MPRHVIVDGSNIATEGRTMPSLKQLSEAVTAFMEEFPDDLITVVVDATFGHRIDPSEVADFDEAIAHNELVAPPAGAIGRGDSFILSIANKTKGSILTNDSYQEFHGEYPWVFDEGRLIGGKPVPNVGWVFVLRTPVRGPVSRKSVKAGRSVNKNTGRAPRASKEASLPMPVPKAPPPGVLLAGVTPPAPPTPKATEGEGRSGRHRGGSRSAQPAPVEAGRTGASAPTRDATPRDTSQRDATPPRDGPVNDLMAFINFVEHHPVGSSLNAVVESYSSHGAYVTVGDVRGYVPLRLMSDPPARTARELGKVGDAITLVVHSFTPGRRSIDMAVPAAAVKAGVQPAVEPAEVEAAVIAEVSPDLPTSAAEAPAKTGRRSGTRRAAAKPQTGSAPRRRRETEAPEEPVSAAARSRRGPKRSAEASDDVAAAATEVVAAAVIETATDGAAAPKRRPSKRATESASDGVATEAAPVKATRRGAAKKAAAVAEPVSAETSAETTPVASAPPVSPALAGAQPSAPSAPAVAGRSKRPAAKAAPARPTPAVKAAPAARAASSRSTDRDAAPPAPTKKQAAKKAPAASAAKATPPASAARKQAATKAPPAKQAPAKAAADAVPAKQAPGKKAAAKKAPAKKAAARPATQPG